MNETFEYTSPDSPSRRKVSTQRGADTGLKAAGIAALFALALALPWPTHWVWLWHPAWSGALTIAHGLYGLACLGLMLWAMDRL